MKQRISLITSIFTIIILVQIFLGVQYDKFAKVDERRNYLEEKIDNFYIPQQVSFEETLQSITYYISKTDQFLGIGGFSSSSPEFFDSVVFEEIMLARETNDFNLLLSNTENYFSERANYFDTLPSIWPLEFSPRLRITSEFGERFSPITGKIQSHTGIDIVSTLRAKVLSTAPGKIIEYWPVPGTKINGVVYKGHPVFGGYIIIDHENGYRTHYAHLSEIYVNKNSNIDRGTVIGRTGNTGLSMGEHLHYGIEKINNETKEWDFIDPINFLRGVN